jgi:phage terminase small subunit
MMAERPKLTIKQEKFSRQYVGPAEGNASEAYRKSYAATNMSAEAIRVEACRLLERPNVSLMVDQLKAEQANQNAITIEEITAGLRRAAESAAAAGHESAATQALLGLAKLGGLLVEKRQVSVDDARDHLDAVADLANVPTAPIVPIMAADPDDDHVTH